jgi:hypothetical protein
MMTEAQENRVIATINGAISLKEFSNFTSIEFGELLSGFKGYYEEIVKGSFTHSRLIELYKLCGKVADELEHCHNHNPCKGYVKLDILAEDFNNIAEIFWNEAQEVQE